MPSTDVKAAYLIHLNQVLSEAIQVIPLEHFYFRINFNSNDIKDGENKENVIVITCAQLSQYLRLILGLSNVLSPKTALKEHCKSIRFYTLRSKLYQYALTPQMCLNFACIYSQFIGYDVEAEHSESKHAAMFKEIVTPYIRSFESSNRADLKA